MATTTLLTTALLFGYTAAQGCDVRGAIGGNIGPVRPNTTNSRYVANANANPNSTTSLKFNFTTASNPNGGAPFTEEWTWRVNISDIHNLPDPNGILGGTLGEYTDPHFTNVVYDFQWPGGEDLNSYLANATNNATGVRGQLCYATLDLKGLPANVSDKYQESDNGSCNNALGEECVNALLAAWNAVTADGTCPAGPGFRTIPECASTLGVPDCSGSFATSLGNTTQASQLNLTRDNLNETYPYQSGQGFWFTSSGLQQGGNTTSYEAYTHTLQAVLLQGAAQKTLLCTKVNTTSRDSSDGNGGGDEGAASGLGASSMAVASVAVLAALFGML